MSHRDVFDYAIVEGGLQGGLAALALGALRPEASLVLIEADSRLGGNHTWCFHAGDLSAAGSSLVAPLVGHSWPGYDVRFPSRSRTVHEPYAAVTSERFDATVRAALDSHSRAELLLGCRAGALGAHEVALENGERVRARVVIDARGPDPRALSGPLAYQKFLGLELELERAHALVRPLLMEANVPQLDGFRFVYVLPLSPTRVLVEDTYYSDSSTLDRETLRTRVLGYALSQGWVTAALVREEAGVLPLPLETPKAPRAELPLRAGYAGGWFHAVTGYSFPAAVRLALHVATRGPGELFDADWAALAREHQRQQRYFCFLNRLLFRAFRPEDRWNVLARFYGLPEATIRRFYAMTTTAADRTRIVCGRPPRGISLPAALRGATS